VCRLEDGFGWDEICPYLGVPTPPAGTEWPGRNQPEEFFQISNKALNGGNTKGLVFAASVLAPLLAVGIWYAKADGARWLPKFF